VSAGEPEQSREESEMMISDGTVSVRRGEGERDEWS